MGVYTCRHCGAEIVFRCHKETVAPDGKPTRKTRRKKPFVVHVNGQHCSRG